MPQDAPTPASKPNTFQQTAPKDQAPLTNQEAQSRALSNEAGAPAVSPSEDKSAPTGPADATHQEVLAADEDAALGEDNLHGKTVQIRHEDGTEEVVASEQEAGPGDEVLGAASGLPFVASEPAYLRNQKKG